MSQKQPDGEIPNGLGEAWLHLHQDVRELATIIRSDYPDYKTRFKGLVVIARGGYGSGVILAHELGISNVRSVSMSSYRDDNTRGDMKVNQIFTDEELEEYGGTPKEWLIHDELADSGATLIELKKYIPKSVVSVVYIKAVAMMSLTYNGIPYVYSKEIPQDEWVTLPWEITTQNQDEVLRK